MKHIYLPDFLESIAEQAEYLTRKLQTALLKRLKTQQSNLLKPRILVLLVNLETLN